jgi:hypothetical protein
MAAQQQPPIGWTAKGPLVEREHAVPELGQHLVNAVQLGLLAWIVGLLPRFGPLEGHFVALEDLAEPFLADRDLSDWVVTEVAAQLPQAPIRERLPGLLRAVLGRLDDERLVVSRYQAGTATRPLGVQRRHPHIVEPVDHLPQAVRAGLHQPSDHLDRVPTRRCQDHHRPPVTDHVHLAFPTTPGTIRCSWRPSASVHRRTFTRWLMAQGCPNQRQRWWTPNRQRIPVRALEEPSRRGSCSPCCRQHVLLANASSTPLPLGPVTKCPPRRPRPLPYGTDPFLTFPSPSELNT